MERDIDDADVFDGCEKIEADEIASFLKRDLRDIEVGEDETFRLSPDNKRCKDVFGVVRPRKFEHLQALGFVPAGLAENKVRDAIAADDDAVLTMALRTPDAGGGCGCHGDAAGAANPIYGSPVRQSYDRMRKAYNPALVSVMSTHYGTRVAWDSPVARVTRKWVGSLIYEPVVVIAALQNITIAQNATMSVQTAIKSLLAGNIWIHRTGQLVHQGGYLKIWANRLERYHHLNFDMIKAEAMKISPVWQN